MNHTKGQPGSRKTKNPERLCLACRMKSGKRELIRVIRTPDGEVRIDPTGRANGRGAYVCPNPECIGKLRKSGALSRSLKSTVPEEIYEELLHAAKEES